MADNTRSLDPLEGITDLGLCEDLRNDLLAPFHSVMEKMYTAAVQWDQYDMDNPIARVLRADIDRLCDAVKALVRRHQGKSELSSALRLCLREIDDYNFVDKPVFIDGVLNRQESSVRSDFATIDDRKKRPDWVEYATSCALDRETVLRGERERMAEAIDQIISQTGPIREEKEAIEKIEWIASAAAFEHVFSTLAAQGYLRLPTKKGKEGDANLSHFARQLLQLFSVPGNDGKPITAEKLRNRLSPGSESKLAEAKRNKFQIPPANHLIIPLAEDLE